MSSIDRMDTNRIREHRERLGWSQERLAKAANTTSQTVSRLENGTRRLSDGWMELLANAMGIRKADLLIEIGEGGRPRASDFVHDPVERRLLLFWRALSPEAQDVVLDFVDSWAARRLSLTKSRGEF